MTIVLNGIIALSGLGVFILEMYKIFTKRNNQDLTDMLGTLHTRKNKKDNVGDNIHSIVKILDKQVLLDERIINHIKFLYKRANLNNIAIMILGFIIVFLEVFYLIHK